MVSLYRSYTLNYPIHLNVIFAHYCYNLLRPSFLVLFFGAVLIVQRVEGIDAAHTSLEFGLVMGKTGLISLI